MELTKKILLLLVGICTVVFTTIQISAKYQNNINLVSVQTVVSKYSDNANLVYSYSGIEMKEFRKDMGKLHSDCTNRVNNQELYSVASQNQNNIYDCNSTSKLYPNSFSQTGINNGFPIDSKNPNYNSNLKFTIINASLQRNSLNDLELFCNNEAKKLGLSQKDINESLAISYKNNKGTCQLYEPVDVPAYQYGLLGKMEI
jgi:hypothetical protein